ncbi:MAG TPA: glycosyltransferase [Pseudonocardiaceae bacterium]|nr:glycosyltransferase [Pseudonocardiaceae bacterium]
MITAVGVVVPARDEAATIGACVRSVFTALSALPPGIHRSVCVVADRCTDDTAAVAELAGVPVVRNRSAITIGEVRDLGVDHIDLAGHPPERWWLLSTDADTTVTPDWAARHLEHARRGAHAVAGVALLAPHAALPAAVARRYSALLAGTRGPEGHGNVYAANLGVRADAYRAVGGFGAVATGEDHDLWRRLRRAGYRCRYAEGPRVVTSARRRGRAPGGLADLLATLDREADVALGR